MSTLDEGEAKTDAPKRKRTGALERILQILDFLQANDQPATAYEIARGVGAPLSTIYVTVDDMVEKDMLDRHEDGTLWFGKRLFHYGLTYARHLNLLTAANHEMTDLALASGETVQLCGRDGDHMVVLAMVDGPDHFQVASQVGSRSPLNWSASGRLLVGHLPEDERRQIFSQATRPSPTGRAETDIEVLTSSARLALEQGLSIQAGESDYSVACIAAPILDDKGLCRATISIVVPDHKVEQADPNLKDLVRQSASRIAQRLGWSR
ncbi:IclR family transcriptional regulator [Pelagibacterium lentulum]|uniref:IclR family transcriptional regulator n=1 Tax=Pelagibacterium lentulum TaxID=2029865 RepID=A0A916R956_9HYPH|nr:IclR family transcriptional regulator [Pelagibacterium lentulum]GGA42769.1 IclR family transcriptional regulator [Pelagibacterium lentulum]